MSPARSRRGLNVFIDDVTLRDLEVFTTNSGHGWKSLIDLVDHTQSRAGRAQLRRLLRCPLVSADDILARQRAHQVLAADAGACGAEIERAGLDAAEEYLGSKWRLPAASGLVGFGFGAWAFGWRKAYLQDVEAGQSRILNLIDASMALGRRIGGAKGPAFDTMRAEFDATLASEEIVAVRRVVHGRGLQRLAFDQLARQDAAPVLKRLIELVGQVEALWSLGVATRTLGWTFPKPSTVLRAEGLRHPCLGERAVPCNVDMGAKVRVGFLTGPNMAGKSTFLKSAALALLLAHVGAGVPAASFEFPIYQAIFASLNVTENLAAGESFYLAEVKRLRTFAQALLERGATFAILDEPLRGTNVHDAAEATVAVISQLVEHPSVLAVIASHVGEVVPSIADDPRVSLLQFSADIDGDGEPRFDYILRPGVSHQRLGMTLLRREGVLDLLQSAANDASVQV
jgi:DNA mismatch repair protein MutS